MAIQMRQGNEIDFDAEKMLPGEWAVSTDAKIVRICFAPGIVARMATYEAFEADMVKIEAILKNVQDIQTAVKLVQVEINGKSELVAENASMAEEYMLKAKEYAEQAGAFTGMQIAKRDLLGVVKGGDMAVEDDGALRNFKRGAGNTFAVSDTVESPFSAYKLYGKSVQETVSGNQLLDLRNGKGGTGDGVTFTNNGDGIYKMSGTATGGTGNVWFAGGFAIVPSEDNSNVIISLEAGTYTITDCTLFTMIDGNSKEYRGRFTISETLKVTGVRNPDFPGGETYNKTIYPMINVGSTALPWEPYVGGIPSPNPSFPQPIVSVGEKLATGKNLYNNATSTNQGLSDDGTISNNNQRVLSDFIGVSAMTYTLTFHSSICCFIGYGVYDSAKNFLSRVMLDDLSGRVSFTPTQNGYIRLMFRGIDEYSDNVPLSVLSEIMLNSGSTALPWEPYTGGKKAVYDVGIRNDIYGKNLLDKNNPTGTSYIDLVGEIHSSADWSVSNYIHVAPEKSYVLHGLTSHPNSNRDNYLLYDSNRMYIGYKSVNILTDYPISFGDAAYVRFSYKTAESDTIMFNEGEEQPYIPYTNQSHTLSKSITLHGIGDVRDELTPDGVGRKFKKVVFDGSDDEEWEDAKGKAPFGIKISDIKPALNGNLPPNAICTHYIPVSNVADWSQYDYLMSYFGGDFTLIRFRNIGISSLDEWKAELHSNPITVVYELAEPIIEPLSEADQIALRSLHSYNGVTTVMSDAWAEVECATSNVAALSMYIKRDYVPKAKYDALESRISALEQQIVNA